MTEEELRQYHDGFIAENGELETQGWTVGTTFYNAHKTNRKAWRGLSWINYWRAMTGNYANAMHCAACNTKIFAEPEKVEGAMTFLSNYDPSKGGSLQDFQAEGAHLYRNGVNADDGYWIIPLCKKCNHPTNNLQMVCKSDVTVCEELAATEED